MSYDEEEQRRSRVVVETPTSRREVVQTQTTRTPERSGFSGGMIAVVALVAIAATAIIFMFLMNSGDDTANTNVRIATQQPTPLPQSTVVIQQPATAQPPIIIQAPPSTMQPAPVIVTPPSSSTTPATATGAMTSATDDTMVQTNVDKEFRDDTDISTTDVSATVVNGKATLSGTVNSQDLKRRAGKLASKVKGVRSVDNQIIVGGSSSGLTSP